MRKYRQTFVLAIMDIGSVNLAYILGLCLRFDGNVPQQQWMLYLKLLPYLSLVPLLIFYIAGLYHRVWRFASSTEFFALIKAVILCAIFFYLPAMLFGAGTLSLSVIIITTILLLLFAGGSRFSMRIMARNKPVRTIPKGEKQPVLIIGAGGAGALVARTLLDNNSNLKPIGFVDDNPEKIHKQIYGLPIMGNREDIPRLVNEHEISEIILAIPSIPRQEVRRLLGYCSGTSARFKILPSVFKVIDGQLSLDQIRSVQLEDLLGREAVELNTAEIAGYLANQVVLVTGAGGSIGSELCREIAAYSPQCLILLGHGENSIYDIYSELSQNYPKLKITWEIADIRDRERIEAIFVKYRPKVVFHAAAHKHVPLMETAPYEAFTNNVLGTINAARAAGLYGAGTFIMISTDKAVNPTSIMGATKRTAELAVLNLAQSFPATKYAAVRFGNVLGSRGSVLPLFKRQIAAGGPVTVTHPEMTRYFMLIREAVQLVIQAGAMAAGGELFILDMGDPLKIVDLARDLIKLSGFEPGREIEIVYTGIRPGEKISEELLTAEEGTTATCHRRIFTARPLEGNLERLEALLDRGIPPELAANPAETLNLLKVLVPNFEHD